MSALFQTSLAENLQFGHILEICAKAEGDASWFHISLTTGKFNDNKNIDIGLHMLVYNNENTIAFKQCKNNKWFELKSVEFETFVFSSQFKINIIMDEENFHIGVNNEPCMFVKYGRVPLSRLNTVKINGHLEYIKQVDHRKYYPYPWPPIQVYEDRVDFSNDQPMSFAAGHVMVIKAKLSGNSQGRFIIHLRNAWNVDRQELHVSVRFDTKQFIMNTKIPKGNNDLVEFGVEEISGQFPFEDFHNPFKLAIAFTETEFKIAKDGQFICVYAFRTPNALKDIVGVKFIGIDGVNVRVGSIDHVQMNDPKCLDFENYSKLKYS